MLLLAIYICRYTREEGVCETFVSSSMWSTCFLSNAEWHTTTSTRIISYKWTQRFSCSSLQVCVTYLNYGYFSLWKLKRLNNVGGIVYLLPTG